MRILIPCMQCLQELGRPSDKFSQVEFRDDGKYELTCSREHRVTTVLQQQKFEVLFDIGAHAILDGYYREAVSSFAASLERFYEFAIRVFLASSSGSDELFKSAWKPMSSQSERQLGGFVLLWASTFKTLPTLLNTARVSFRNDVIHKGKIPTREEAVAFGNAVLGAVRPNMLTLREKLYESVQQVVFFHLRDAQPTEGSQQSTMCLSTIVSLSAGEKSHHEADLDEHLRRLSEWRRVQNGLGANG